MLLPRGGLPLKRFPSLFGNAGNQVGNARHCEFASAGSGGELRSPRATGRNATRMCGRLPTRFHGSYGPAKAGLAWRSLRSPRPLSTWRSLRSPRTFSRTLQSEYSLQLSCWISLLQSLHLQHSACSVPSFHATQPEVSIQSLQPFVVVMFMSIFLDLLVVSNLRVAAVLR